MEQLNHRDYYLGRATTAHEAARRAINPAIAAIHTEMADRYERAAGQLSGSARQPLENAQAA